MAFLSLTEVSESKLKDVPITDGQLIFCRDTGNFYKDSATSRNPISSDFLVVNDLPLAPLVNKLYLLLPNTLCFYNNGVWEELNESPVVTKDTKYAFPNIGSASKIYVATAENKTYRWNDDDLKYYCIGSDYNDINIINGGGAA